MASRSLGTLTLDLIARIGGFQQGMNQASRSVASTGAAADAASARINALQGQFLSLSSVAARVAGPLAAAFSVHSVYQATEAYSTLTNRLKLVTTGSADLAQAQKAVFDIAQASAQPLSSTAELYQRIATNQDALKLSGKEVAGVVGTVSKTLAISGASAESANAALIQLGQAFASGVLRGEELNSVMEQAPALSQAIAAGMGKTVGELRAMGAAGELTAQAVVKAIQSQAGAVDVLFAKTATTIGNSFTKIGNSMTHFVGELDQATGASSRVAAEFVNISKAIDNSLPAAMDAVTKNSEVLSQVLTTGLYVALGRVAGGYAALIPVSISRSMAAAQEAKTSLAAASAATRKAEVDLVSAKNAVQLAALNRRLATTATEVMIAENALSAAKAKALVLTERLTVARGAESAANLLVASTSTAAGIATGLATRAVTALVGAARGLLALFGGPVGLVFVAGAVALSFVDFSSKSKTLMGDLGALGQSVDQVRAEFKKLNDDQQRAQVNTWKDKQLGAALAVKEAYSDLKTSIKSSMVNVSDVRSPSYLKQLKGFEEVSAKLDAAKASGQALGPVLREAAASGQISPEQLKAWENQAGVVSDNIVVANQINERLGLQTELLGQNTGATVSNNQAKSGFTATGEKYLKTLQAQLGKLQDNNDAVKEASRYIDEHTDLSEADKTAIMSAAYASKAQEDANKAATKELKNSTSALSESQKAREADAKAIADTVQRLDLQAKQLGWTSEQIQIYELRTRGATDAQIKGVDASLKTIDAYNKQKEAVEKYKNLVSELRTEQERQTDTLRDQFKVIDEMPNLPTSERSAVVGRALGAATTEAPTFEGIAPEIGGAFGELAKVDDAQAELEKWYSSQLEMLETFRNERKDMSAQFDAEELALKQQHESALAGIERGRQLAQLAAAQSVFGDLAGMAKTFAGEQSGIYKAMFAVQKAASIAQSIVAIQTGIAMASANPFPANLAAMASVAAATASIVGNIGAVGMAHDGMSSIPKEGTWLLDGGERIVTPAQNKDLTNFLARQTAPTVAASGVGGAPQINITINADGMITTDSTAGYEERAMVIARAVLAADGPALVRSGIMREKGQNGLLDPSNRRNT